MVDILTNMFDLLASYLNLGFLNLWFFPMIALSFLASVPAIIRVLTTWR